MDANTPSSEELDGVDPKVYHRRWLILATMCLSLLMISVAISSVNVAIPTISRSELRPKPSPLQPEAWQLGSSRRRR